jgi:hypothetical protein
MTLEQELLALEKQFWTAGPEFYRRHVDEQCLLAFPEMVGLMSRDSVVATIKEEQRWSDLTMEEQGFLRLNDGTAVLTYHTRAHRADGGSYEALVSSAYVKRNGSWKLAFHQQTPVEA